MQTRENEEQDKRNPIEIVFYGITWALSGALYAALFIPVLEIALGALPVWAAAICATVAATVVGALVYSSHQLTLLVALVTNFAVFAQLLYSGDMGPPTAPISVGAGAGAIVGALYGLGVKGSRISSADARLLAGIVVGLVISLISLVWILAFQASLTVLVVVLAPLSGFIYVLIVDDFTKRFSDILPPVGDGAVAGALIGGFIGFGMWVVGGFVLETVAAEWQDTIAIIAESTPIAIAAAGGSTFLAGIVYGTLKPRLEAFASTNTR